MSSIACQRWNPGAVQSWRRPEDGGFDARRYGVSEIGQDRAKPFVLACHYSGSFPAAIRSYGMTELASGRLVGVAVLSVPAQRAVLTSVFPHLEAYTESAEVGRFCLLNEVAANGESWMLGECRRLAAAAGVRGLVMFSDPVERRRADGTVIMPGHVGCIYQAVGCDYLGRATPRTLTLLRDGTVFSDRAAQKIRAGERGHEYAERRLVAMGARPARAGENPAAWLAGALDDVGARKIRHPGNHRYAIRLGVTRRERAAVVVGPRPGAYPKKHAGQLDLFA